MPSWRTEIEGASIILLGKFNPAIFQPAWLSANNLLRKEEADIANIDVINPQVTSFSAAWLRIQVLAGRFQATTADPGHYQTLRDIVLSIFQLLEHTPFWTMGMNRDMHFKIKDEARWHQLGDLLAPKQLWSPVLREPGLRSLIIQSSPSTKGKLHIVHNVTVAPSVLVQPGVYMQLNIEASRRDAVEPDPVKADVVVQQQAARELRELLGVSWNDMLSESQRLADHLLSQV